jgi:hypothetical protein
MAYTALTLIDRAYNLSRIVSRGLQSVTGTQQEQGLFLLNAILDTKGTNTRLIPYFSQYDGTFVAGQETYFIPNLYGVESMTFNIGSVRYPMAQVPRKAYFGAARANNISSLPYNYHVERKYGGANVYVYYLPNNTYAFQIWGKFGLTNVTLNQDMSLTYDNFYLEYLRYALAEYICEDSGVNFAPQSAARLKQYEKILLDVSPPDLTIGKLSTLQNTRVLNYAIANLSTGWLP